MDIKCELVNKPQIIHKYQGTNEITSRIARILFHALCTSQKLLLYRYNCNLIQILKLYKNLNVQLLNKDIILATIHA